MLTHIQKCDCFHDIGSFQSIRLCWNVGKLPDGNHCHSQRIVVYTYQQKSTHPHMSECTNVKGVKTFERKCWDVVSNTLCWCPQRLLSPDIMVRNPTRLDTFWPVFSDNADLQWLKPKHSLEFENMEKAPKLDICHMKNDRKVCPHEKCSNSEHCTVGHNLV